ncbi:MAG: succinate dehydrogenase, cytochrome b556 subunit [Micavibrio aeruginosavorus]|uniref:Succinate dehydrogenase cytochrome b556 subunit n=1 Tax=Micavibrio aeruginosavorus TaxID=349221 RepID=A0A2W5FP05_9BACT|nr:MAG: succinate dehydrogenase, cytochrome b556 subunit [Micavibrio aeruginosavorus]
MKLSPRPLSPHLQVWKWTLTMAMSILHRATGSALTVGLVMVVWWLMAAATGPDAYAVFMSFATSLIGKLMFIGWTFAIYLHMLSGIRHLIMDTGKLLDIKSSDMAIIFILAAATVLTAVTWLTIYGTVQ